MNYLLYKNPRNNLEITKIAANNIELNIQRRLQPTTQGNKKQKLEMLGISVLI